MSRLVPRMSLVSPKEAPKETTRSKRPVSGVQGGENCHAPHGQAISRMGKPIGFRWVRLLPVDSVCDWRTTGERLRFAVMGSRRGRTGIAAIAALACVSVAAPSAPAANPLFWGQNGILFARTINPGTMEANTDVWRMRADGTHQRRLTTGLDVEADAVWSPNGKKIAYTDYGPGNDTIYVMNADGSNAHPVT